MLLHDVALGYDIGARLILSLGFGQALLPGSNSAPHHGHDVWCNRSGVRNAAANSRGVRHAFLHFDSADPALQYWERDRKRVEKAFDFGGMGARNGVASATIMASSFTGVDGSMSGNGKYFYAVGKKKPMPDELATKLGKRWRS